jgi:hypothetical protein
MIETTYTAAEVADGLRVSIWWVRRMVQAGAVTPRRVGTSRRAPMRFTEAHVKALEARLTPPAAHVETPAPPRRQRARRRAA